VHLDRGGIEISWSARSESMNLLKCFLCAPLEVPPTYAWIFELAVENQAAAEGSWTKQNHPATQAAHNFPPSEVVFTGKLVAFKLQPQ